MSDATESRTPEWLAPDGGATDAPPQIQGNGILGVFLRFLGSRSGAIVKMSNATESRTPGWLAPYGGATDAPPRIQGNGVFGFSPFSRLSDDIIGRAPPPQDVIVSSFTSRHSYGVWLIS